MLRKNLIIPEKIWNHEKLSTNQKWLFSILLRHVQNGDGRIIISQEKLCKETGWSESTLENVLKLAIKRNPQIITAKRIILNTSSHTCVHTHARIYGIKTNPNLNLKNIYILNLNLSLCLSGGTRVPQQKDSQDSCQTLPEQITPKLEKQNSPQSPAEVKHSAAEWIFDYWTALSQVPNHRRGTKIHRRSIRLINQLLKGTFGDNDFDPDWMSKNKVPEKLLSRKWTRDEIFIAMDEMAKMFLDGYFPLSKKYLPKQLDTLLFDRIKQKSIFLLCYIRPIRKASEVINQINDKHPNLTGIFESILPANLQPYDQTKLIKSVKLIYEFFEKQTKRVNKQVANYWSIAFVSEASFCIHYTEWLEEQYENWDKGITVNMIGPDAKNWPNFLKHLSEYVWQGDYQCM